MQNSDDIVASRMRIRSSFCQRRRGGIRINSHAFLTSFIWSWVGSFTLHSLYLWRKRPVNISQGWNGAPKYP